MSIDNSTVDTLPGLDKAAILFQILGESLALTMFQNLSESNILKIRVRSKELKNVPSDLNLVRLKTVPASTRRSPFLCIS